MEGVGILLPVALIPLVEWLEYGRHAGVYGRCKISAGQGWGIVPWRYNQRL